jgi:hypothetical protein
VVSYFSTFAEEVLMPDGISKQLQCEKDEGHDITYFVLEVYLVVCTCLLLNMLIAMSTRPGSNSRP